MQRDETTSLDTTATSDSGKWVYRCIFCSKTFSSGRALGGHQNAHRFEMRESKRTHHMRVPRQQDPSNSSAAVVQSAASHMNNVRPQNPSHVRPTAGNVGAPLIQPAGWSNGQQGRRQLGFGDGTAGIMPSMGTARYNYYQAASNPMPVQERDHNLQEWQNLIARAGQGMQSETSRTGSAAAAANGVDQDGVAEVDLELKLYF